MDGAASMLRFSRYAWAAGLAVISICHAMAAEPFGTFVRPSNGAQVNFYDCGGKLCGKIVAVRDASHSKQVGMVILKGAAKVGDNQCKGDLLDPDSGKTYAGVVSLAGENGLSLKGCAMGVFCSGETWRRVK